MAAWLLLPVGRTFVFRAREATMSEMEKQGGADGSPPGAPSTKDFAEQARTVHFSLLGVCFALLVLAFSRTRGEVVQAREQIETMLAIRTSWHADFLERGFFQELKDYSTAQGPAAAFLAGGGRLSIVRDGKNVSPAPAGIFPEFNYIISGGSRENPIPFARSGLSPFSVTPPETPKAFRAIWDALATNVILDLPLSVSDGAYRLSDGATASVRTDQSPVAPAQVLDLKLVATDDYADFDRLWPRQAPIKDGRRMYYTFHEAKPDRLSQWRIPVVKQSGFTKDFQVVLMSEIPGTRAYGRYKDAFREADSLITQFEDLPLDAVERVVASELKRTADAFEVFGVKVPADAAAIWGAFLVISLQGYLAIHLQELQKRLRLGHGSGDVAWVGVYEATSARALMAMSIGVLPVLTVAILDVRSVWSPFANGNPARVVWSRIVSGQVGALNWSLFAASLFASASLAFLTWRRLPGDAPSFATAPHTVQADEPRHITKGPSHGRRKNNRRH